MPIPYVPVLTPTQGASSVPTSYPDVRVLLDDAANGRTFPYDITRWWKRQGTSISLSTRGTTDEVSAPQPVTLSLSLDNTDGRFTLGTTWGGYGAINVERGIRLQVIVNGQTFTVFTGFVQAWPTSWPNNTDQAAVATVTAVDAMARWARRTLRSVPEEVVLGWGPTVYYTLGEPQGADAVADSSGNAAPRLIAAPDVYVNDVLISRGPTFGDGTGPGTDGLTAMTTTHSTTGVYSEVPSLDVPPVSWVSAWVRAEAAVDAQGNSGTPFVQIYGSQRLQVFVGNGNLVARWRNNDSTVVEASAPFSLGGLNGFGFTVFAVASAGTSSTGKVRLYLNGNLFATATGTVTPGTRPAGWWNGLQIGMTDYANATLAHVAGGDSATLYDPTGAGPALDFVFACSSGYDGDTTGLRLLRLGRWEGHSAAEQYLGQYVGQSQMPFVEQSGKSVAEAAQQVGDAEMGVVFIDGSGTAVLHDRFVPSAKPNPDLIVPLTTGLVRPDVSVQADAQMLVNYAEGSRTGDSAPTMNYLDAASENVHGRYGNSQQLALRTDAEVMDRLLWLVRTHAEPQPRIPELPLNLYAVPAAQQAAVLGLDLGAKIRLTGLPLQSPLGQTVDLTVVGYSMTLSMSEWTWTANVVPWDAYYRVLMLDDPVYGALDEPLNRLAV